MKRNFVLFQHPDQCISVRHCHKPCFSGSIFYYSPPTYIRQFICCCLLPHHHLFSPISHGFLPLFPFFNHQIFPCHDFSLLHSLLSSFMSYLYLHLDFIYKNMKTIKIFKSHLKQYFVYFVQVQDNLQHNNFQYHSFYPKCHGTIFLNSSIKVSCYSICPITFLSFPWSTHNIQVGVSSKLLQQLSQGSTKCG